MYVGSGHIYGPQGVGFNIGGQGLPSTAIGHQGQADVSSTLLGGPWGTSAFGGTVGSYAGAFAGMGTLGQMTGYFIGDSHLHQGSLGTNYTDHLMNLGSAVWVEEVVTETPGKMWDVWFDHVDGQKTTQRSPIVLDLNGNGKPDITGANVTGNGKIDGATTLFDIDPTKASWEFKSIQRRPGNGAPSVPGGRWIEQDGRKLYVDKDGTVQGELKRTGAGGKEEYHWGKQETREKTEWLAKDGGDGLLVWDVNKDGKITSSKELFSEFDIDGKKRFANGYEKLAFHFDKDGDGLVQGEELKGLQIWKDANADGKVDSGELRELSEFGITSLNVGDYDAKTMEGSFGVETRSQEIRSAVWAGFNGAQGPENATSGSFGMAVGGVYGAGGLSGWGGTWNGQTQSTEALSDGSFNLAELVNTYLQSWNSSQLFTQWGSGWNSGRTPGFW